MIKKKNLITNLKKIYDAVSIKENKEDRIIMKSPYIEALRYISSEECIDKFELINNDSKVKSEEVDSKNKKSNSAIINN